MVAEGFLYSREHEWVKAEEGRATIGISHFAQGALGDIIYVAPPVLGRCLLQGEEITEVESTKAVSPVYAPVGGKIIVVNEGLKDNPELINKDPYGQGWIVVVEMTNPEEVNALMTAEAYALFLKDG